MQLSKNGLELLKNLEGFRAEPYKDSAGIWTIGYGFTYYLDGKKVEKTDPAMTQKQAELILEDLFKRNYARYIPANVNQNQFDALALFIYNIGPSAFNNSTLKRKVLVNPDDQTIRNEFMKWNKVTVNGKKVEVKGLTNRRNWEAELYFS